MAARPCVECLLLLCPYKMSSLLMLVATFAVLFFLLWRRSPFLFLVCPALGWNKKLLTFSHATKFYSMLPSVTVSLVMVLSRATTKDISNDSVTISLLRVTFSNVV